LSVLSYADDDGSRGRDIGWKETDGAWNVSDDAEETLIAVGDDVEEAG
jgi:hypothetical protein